MSEIPKSVIKGDGDEIQSILGENMARISKGVNNDNPTGSRSIQPTDNGSVSKSPKRPLNTGPKSSDTEGSSDLDTDEERQIKVCGSPREPVGNGRDTVGPNSAKTVQGQSEDLHGELTAEKQSLAALYLAEINRKVLSVSWKP